MRILFLLALLALPLASAQAMENADELANLQYSEGPSTTGGGGSALNADEQRMEICRSFSGKGYNSSVKRRNGSLFGGDGKDPSYLPICGISTDL